MMAQLLHPPLPGCRESANVTLVDFGDLASLPLDLKPLGLHLPVARKGLHWIGAELLHPFA